MTTNNCYDKEIADIQITYNEKREDVFLLLNTFQISESEFNQIMEQISDEEEACYGEVHECEIEESIYI